MLIEPHNLLIEIPASETVPAHKLACYEWGSRSNPNHVVCVHGLTRNGRDFDFLAHALSKNFHVICPDIAGRGASGRLPAAAYNYATYVSDMVQLLKQLELPQVHWIGTSMGGIIGMTLATTAPTLLRSLTLNDIGCLIPAQGLKRILSYAGVSMEFATRAEAEAALRINCKPFGIPSEEHWQHLFAHSLITTVDGKTSFAYDPNIISSMPKADAVEDANMWGLMDGLSKLKTLLIRGEISDILTRETAMEMQTKHPALTYHEIKDTGHAPALMAEDQINLIGNWLLKL